MTTIKIIFKLIRWSVKTILVIMGIIPFTRCSSGYKNEDGKITFDGKEITDKSFVVLNEQFAKDSATAYYKSRSFSYADVPSFVAVDDHYAKDKDKVFYCDEYREGQNYYLTKKQTIVTIHGAVPAYFVSLGSSYAKDNQHAYFAGIPFKVKDLETLKTIDNNFIRDDVMAYINRVPIQGSDGKTFEKIDPYYAKDTSHVYFYNAGLEGSTGIVKIACDKASFDTLRYPYSKDKSSAFYAGKKIEGVDGSTFVVLGHGYSKDKSAVYFSTRKIAADAQTFELFKENDDTLDELKYAKDNTHIFINEKMINGADVGTFKILKLGYGSDANHVFYKMNMVKDASVASFKTYDHGFGETDSEDAKNKYLAGKIVKE